MDTEAKNSQMKKRMRIMLIGLAILFGCIIVYKIFMSILIGMYISSLKDAVQTVSTMEVKYADWPSERRATGSLRAIQGINVTTELAGMVQTIYFTPGAVVKKGDALVQLNADTEIAQLNALIASQELARINLNRDQKQYNIQAVSKSQVDTDVENLKNFTAQVAQQKTIIAKKTIVAPFSGKLGISAVNLGQYINVGDKVVTLQQLDPLYLDFYIPQQYINDIKLNQSVRTTSESFPGKIYQGKVTTIDPIVDDATRNVEVEATISNPKFELVPGMFTEVLVKTGMPKRYLTLPHTAVSFNPYGDIIYIVHEEKKKKKTLKTVTQSFVTTGETRGDQVAILDGINEGDIVVTSGQLKLKNGTKIEVNNSVMPANNPNPKTLDE
ncbi:MAG: efflux RND transporter periplasmic adaptor subunit [Gammaproteobacteria bacterium]|nr:efflux RND transporter periplasmic adaptor subunit [Gammaproteobacteria bacterium]